MLTKTIKSNSHKSDKKHKKVHYLNKKKQLY